MKLSDRNADSGSACPPNLNREAVRHHLEKILQSPGFQKSERLKRFLNYTVERVLSGDTGDLKEYSVALEVFDRSPAYNPKIDAVVRVEARRLRLRLEQYYAAEGANESIRIQFPVGTYIPLIVEAPSAAKAGILPKPARPHYTWWLLAGASLLALAALIWQQNQGHESPAEVIRVIKDSSAAFEPAVSRDGKTLAYASDQSGNVDIWLRPLAGGEGRRLTSDEAMDHSPDFSPDARYVAFRSERSGGGVYIIPVAGGSEHLIAPLGRSPKFSPDGKWLAYWTGQEHHFEAKTFIVPSTGGKPVLIASDLADARWPVWSPDGRSLLVLGSRAPPHNSGIASGPTDLFVVPINGGTARETGWTASLRRAKIWSQVPAADGPVSWNGAVLQFSASTTPLTEFSGITQEVANLWQVRLPARTGRVEGEPRRLTFGAASERDSVLLPDGGAIYSSSRYTLTTFQIPLDDAGLPHPPFRPSFSSPGGYVLSRLSRDGSTLVALSDRSGQIDIWLKDLRNGDERAITSTSVAERAPLISSNGETIYYGIREGPLYPIYRVSAKGGTPQQICADCGSPSDISPKGDYLLYHAGEPWSAYGLNLLTGNKTLIAGNSHRTYSSSFSPDGKWIAFLTDTGDDAAPRRIFVAPFSPDQTTPESKWIPITDGLQTDFDPAWSTNGGMVFFISDRDGNRCIWAIPLNPRDKHAAGPALPVIHLHRMAYYIPGSAGASIFGISSGHGTMIFGAMELSSAIYRIENAR